MEMTSQEKISSTTGKPSFPEVEKIVQSWMSDYYYTALCRLFKDRSAEKFHKTLQIFQEIVDELESGSDSWDQTSQRTVCCFLARVMDGENLDVYYDRNAHVTPLMSSLPVWELLEDVVRDAALHAKIKTLLIVQCVAVCLRKGNIQKAKDTLTWLEKKTRIPENLHRKLTTVVNKKDALDKLLMSSSYTQLLEKIDTFLDAHKRSSVFLLEAASKVVQARHTRSEKTLSSQESGRTGPSSPESDKSKENETQAAPQVANTRRRKKLLSKQTEPWKPETAIKKQRTLKRTSVCKVSRRSSRSSVLQTNITTNRTRRKWTSGEDKKLKAGVRRHGVGKWTLILNEFDFENRTSVMLKDRWRTLKKLEMV